MASKVFAFNPEQCVIATYNENNKEVALRFMTIGLSSVTIDDLYTLEDAIQYLREMEERADASTK